MKYRSAWPAILFPAEPNTQFLPIKKLHIPPHIVPVTPATIASAEKQLTNRMLTRLSNSDAAREATLAFKNVTTSK
jgi:hypothetical protein